MGVKEKVEQRVRKQLGEKQSSVKDFLDPIFITKCLKNKSLGDGEMFKALFRKNFVFNKAMDCWMFWSGHHWEIDKMGHALASVESVAKIYEDEARRLSKKIKEVDLDE